MERVSEFSVRYCSLVIFTNQSGQSGIDAHYNEVYGGKVGFIGLRVE